MGGSSADLHHHESDIELIDAVNNSASESNAGATDVGHSKPKKEQEEAQYVEVTMDIQGDSVAFHSLKTVADSNTDQKPELAKKLEKKTSVVASLVQNATIRMKHLKRLASFSNPEPAKKLERTKSAVAHALTGLKFISMTDGGAEWGKVEKVFDQLTATTDGYLPRALFGKCIGTILQYKPRCFALPSCFKWKGHRNLIIVYNYRVTTRNFFLKNFSD